MKRYYELDETGRIIGSYSLEQPGKTLVLLDEPEIEFPMRVNDEWVFDEAAQAKHELLKTDAKMSRMLEDLIDALLVDNPALFTKFTKTPDGRILAKETYEEKKRLRELL